MIALPFVWFALLSIYQYRKNKGIDIACYIALIYCVSALFSILMYTYGISSVEKKISTFATFVYCGLLTLCILPFSIHSNVLISHIRPIKNSQIIKNLAWFCFLFFLISTYMSFDSLYNVLTGDFNEIRIAHYEGFGETIWIAKLPSALRYPVYYIDMFFGSPWILEFFAFYSIFIQKLPKKYGLLFLISSLIGITRNLIDAGRSDIIYWFLGLGACIVFFRPFYVNQVWRSLRKYLLILISLFSFFIYTSTTSRFGESEGSGQLGGAESGFVSYAGQAYPNFCYFFDNFTCPKPSMEVIFPYIYQTIYNTNGGIVGKQKQLSLLTNYELGVFYTFIGQIAVTSNNYIAIGYCLLFSLLAMFCVSKTSRTNISLFKAYLYMALASVLFLGLFSHYYGIANKSFSVVAFALLIVWLENNQKRSV